MEELVGMALGTAAAVSGSISAGKKIKGAIKSRRAKRRAAKKLELLEDSDDELEYIY